MMALMPKEHRHTCRFVQLDYLKQKCGVKLMQIDMNDGKWTEQVKNMKAEINSIYEDVLDLSDSAEASQLNKFYTEHLHIDNEARFITDGSGYVDIRDPTSEKEAWIRIELRRGVFILVPTGMYHRFTMDSKGYFRAERYFTGVTAWKALPRPQDDHPARLSYVEKYCRK